MIERIIAKLPEAWRGPAELVAAPIAWVPVLQQTLMSFFFDAQPSWMAVLKYVFLLFPVLLGVVAVWCTGLSVYTMPFRSSRTRFISLVLLAWWDAALAVWLYWVGMVRVAGVVLGWALGISRLAVRLVMGFIREVVGTPFAMSGMLMRSYFKPGVPWLAFMMLLAWCAFEAAVFTYTLEPRVTTLVNDLSGSDDSRFTVPMLYVMLLALVLASFACVQALINALRTKDPRFITQIIGIELFTIFFEVMFLYRGVVEVTMPWIAKDNGAMVATATIGWFGVRGLTWFLFGQYGTPPLLALIARRPLTDAEATYSSGMRSEPFWRPAADDFRRDLDWLHIKSDEMLELLALPVVHLLGAALNFAMILTASRPVFNLPFRSLKEVTESRDMETTMHLEPRKQVSL
ncbi:MAG: hypothetical protein ACRELZ_02330 [Candidatus Rokuibacteriota bacterium]